MEKMCEERKMKEKIELNLTYYFYLLLQIKFIILNY